MADAETKTFIAQNLITEERVLETLKADKGNNAVLISWKVVDFTKPGDNYVCLVTSVKVDYSLDSKEQEVSYIVKLNSHRIITGFPDITAIFFAKEVMFYQEILPALNEVLTSAGQEALHFPKCFHVFLEDGKEQIYFEDLRARDFKMFDRRKGMDKHHIEFAMKELARLHSASNVLMKTILGGEKASKKYEHLSKDWLTFNPEFKKMFIPIFQRDMHTGIMMLEKIGGYETAINWLSETYKPQIENILTDQMQSQKFNSICHGDCWNNNMLFRYNEEGQPTEIMLLDLQICREASLATDLNYFFYTSVTGEIRRPNIDHFMSIYHSTYKDILEGHNLPMYFDEAELLQEFRDKNKVGLAFALMVLPIVIMEPEEVPEMADIDIGNLMRELRRRALDKIDTNPLFKPRFVSMFDEFIETGLISTP